MPVRAAHTENPLLVAPPIEIRRTQVNIRSGFPIQSLQVAPTKLGWIGQGGGFIQGMSVDAGLLHYV